MKLENIISFVRTNPCIACEVMSQALRYSKLEVSKEYDIDTKEGLNKATSYGIGVAPTYMNKLTKAKLVGIVSPTKIVKLNKE